MSNHQQFIAVDSGHSANPEDYFQVPVEARGTLNIDVLTATLSRARAVLLLLESDGDELERGFHLNHKYVMDTLWCIDGLINQAQNIVDQARIVKG